MLDLGLMVMRNLPPFFAIGLAFALSKSEKGWAAFTGFTMFMCFNVAIGSIAAFNGWTPETTSVDYLVNNMGYDKVAAQNFNSLWGENLGVFSYNMGIFSGIIVGCITAALHNRFYKFEMPAMLSFFSGPRAVVIFAYLAIMPISFVAYHAYHRSRVGCNLSRRLLLARVSLALSYSACLIRGYYHLVSTISSPSQLNTLVWVG